MIRLFAAMVLAMSVLLAAPPAAAHTRSESHSSWTVEGTLVRMSFSVADREAARLTPDGRRPSDAALIAYLAPKVGVTAANKSCPSVAPPHILSAAIGFRRVEFQYDCPSAEHLRLMSTAFFELVPTHIHFAQIQLANGEFIEQLLSADKPSVDLGGANGERLRNAGFLQFIEMGILHIFTGVDHMSFLVGLVLISRRLRDLVFVVTGFTIGHSLTLALAVTGIIRPHAEFIDALVALTIAWVGVENIAVATRKPALVALWTAGLLMVMALLRLAGIGLLPPMLLFGAAIFSGNYLMVSGHLRDAGRLRLLVTLVFGLIHGFGFAADLLESRLPAEKLAEILFGFNLGVEIGQLSIVLLITGGVMVLSRWRLTLPRPIVVDVAASALVTIGTYWFIGRSFV